MQQSNPKILVSYIYEDEKHSSWVMNFLVKRLQARYGYENVVAVGGFDNFMSDIVPFLNGQPKQDFLVCICTPEYAKIADSLGIHASLPNLINAPDSDFKRFTYIIPVIRKGEYKSAKPRFLMHSRGIMMNENESEQQIQDVFSFIDPASS